MKRGGLAGNARDNRNGSADGKRKNIPKAERHLVKEPLHAAPLISLRCEALRNLAPCLIKWAHSPVLRRAGHNLHTERSRALSVCNCAAPRVWEGNEAPRQAPRWLVPRFPTRSHLTLRCGQPRHLDGLPSRSTGRGPQAAPQCQILDLGLKRIVGACRGADSAG